MVSDLAHLLVSCMVAISIINKAFQCDSNQVLKRVESAKKSWDFSAGTC